MDSKQPKGGTILSIFCSFFLCFWGGLLINSQALAADVTVCATGCDYSLIQPAIFYVNSNGGGTVTVQPGTYQENIHLLDGVTVVSEGDNSTESYTDGTYSTTVLKRAKDTIIDGGGGTSILVTCPGGTPTLDGFTIQNISGGDTFLVTIGDGAPTIKNNIIRNNLGTGHSGGIGNQGLGTGSPHPLIEHNFIHNVHGPGVGNGHNSHATIRYNEIWDCNGDEGPGIGLWGYAYPTIENNKIYYNSKAGIGSYYSLSGSTGLEAGGLGNTLDIPPIKGNEIIDNCVGNQCAGIGLERVPGDTGDINVTIGGALTSEGNEISCSDHFVAGIRLDDLTNVIIQNNYVHNHFLGGISLGGVTNAEILDNETSYNQAGIQFDSICANATVERNIIHNNNEAGIQNGPSIMHPSGGVDTLMVQNNNIYSNGNMYYSGAGIRIQYAGSTNTIKGNTIRDNGKAGIRAEIADSVTVDDNDIYENGAAGIRNDGADTLIVQNNNDIYLNGKAGISIEWVNSTNIVDGNNTIRENSQGGIRVVGGTSVTVEDNSIYDNGWGGIRNQSSTTVLSVNRNEIVNNGYGGIDIRGGIGEITGNTIEANHYGGIGIKAPCTFEITGNQINGNFRGGIHTGKNSVNGTGFVGTVGDAHLTIKKNKVYGNGQSGFGGGIDVRHADGVIRNNLVYENHRGGIRYCDWINDIINNTVVGNGQNLRGGGIVYDDLLGEVNDPAHGVALNDINIKNNICVNNERAGIRDGCCGSNRDYNLVSENMGWDGDPTCSGSPPCKFQQLAGCKANTGEIIEDPLFVAPLTDDYHLTAGSPAECAGECQNPPWCECANSSKTSMGAYGGTDPITP